MKNQKLIIKRVEGVTRDMVARTNLKFTYWDKVTNEQLLEVEITEDAELTEEEIILLERQKQAYQMLRDPTIYAYAYFKDPRNIDIPFKAYAYQDMIINDTSLRVCFAAANQIGKSIALCLKALVYALHHPGKTVMMVSKVFSQSKDLLRQIKQLLNNSILDYKYDIGDSETKTEIYFKHYEEYEEYDEELEKTFIKTRELPQSRIMCVPATEAALSYAVDLALVDEIAFYEDGVNFYKQILQPRTYTTKGQIIVFSNPNGQIGIFWEIWNDGYFSHYKFDFLDCPTNTQEEFDMLSASLTREQIDSTMLAIFTNPEGGFITLQERRDMQEERESMLPIVITSPVYIFFVCAKSRDRTVRVIGIPIQKKAEDWADEIYVYEMKEYPQGTSYTEIVDQDLKELVKSIGPANVAIVGWDNTGVGRGIEDFVKRVEQLGIQTMPVEFNLENKSRIYTLLKLLIEQRRIKVPKITECDKQLSALRFKKTARGLLQVHHDNEKDRDDFPDAIAGLASLIIQPENVPISAVII